MKKQSKETTGGGLSGLAARFFPKWHKNSLPDRSETPICSHCKQPPTGKIYTSGDAGICSGCLSLYQRLDNSDSDRLLLEELQRPEREIQLLAPSLMVEKLDKRVVGSPAVKEALAVAVHQHILRIRNPNESLKKENVLLIGDSGTGKTELLKALAQLAGVPFVKGDATTITENGWRGDDPDVLLTELLAVAGGDVKRAEMGIVFIDEIDKKASAHSAREDSGKGAQQSLLTILEEKILDVPVRRNMRESERKTVRMDTKNILFIAAGAFVGLEDAVKMHLKEAKGLGRIRITPTEGEAHDLKNMDSSKTSAGALEKYGLIKELIGRFPVIELMDPHTEESLLRVLTDVDEALLKEYKKRVAMAGRCSLEFEKSAEHAVVRKAMERGGSGARDLRAVMAKLMRPILFALPDMANVKSVRITGDVVEGREDPVYEFCDPEEVGKIKVSDRRRISRAPG